ncbi:ABC-type transport system, involved in lipoprotein release, permease component [Lachnospiraceae bacterium NE2001]|nr:ABC-type transport system, involved in lipoprotein release, permease component [Lachnospiraceae bacterium NE2001]
MNKLIKSHIRKDRTILTIFLMIMILSAFLMNIGLMASKYQSLYDEYRDETDLADYIAFIVAYIVPDSEDDISEMFQDAEYVESYYMSDVVSFKSYNIKTSRDMKEKTQDYLMIQNVDDSNLSDSLIFMARDDSVSGKRLYLNIKTAMSNNLEVGDKVYIKAEQGDYEYTVAGIYQHLVMGAFETYNSAMVEEDEFEALLEDRDQALKDGAAVICDKIVTVHVKEGCDVDKCLKETKDSLAKDLLLPADGITSQEVAESSYVSIANILAGFMSAFALLILIISIIIIVFTINNNINRDVTNIGALKAVGYTVAQIRASLMAEYILVGAVGTALGIGLSYVIYPVLEENIIREITGLIWKNRFMPEFSLTIFAGIIVVITFTVFFATMRIRNLHPANALRFGFTSAKRLKNILPMEKTKGEVNTLLAIKTFLQSPIQSFVIVCIVLSVAFITAFSAVLYYNTKVDISKFQRMIMGDVADAYFYVNDTSADAVNDSIKKLQESDPENTYYAIALYYAYIDDKETNLCYTTDPSALSFDLYKGEMFTTDDETVLGSSLADDLGLDIGDEIEASYGGRSKTFRITGIQQSALNNRLYVTEGAAEELGVNTNYEYIRASIKDADTEKVDAVIKKGKALGDSNITDTENSYKYQHSKENAPVYAIGFIVAVLVLTNIAIILLVIRLLLKSIFVKREKEFGIKKALGFTSNQLRFQLSLSLIPATAFASALGAVVGYFFINPLFGLVLSNFGIKSSHLIVRPEIVTAPAIAVTIMVFIFSFIMSGRMKKVSAYKLIQE